MQKQCSPPHLVTLGMFIIDEFEYLDERGRKVSASPLDLQPQVSSPLLNA